MFFYIAIIVLFIPCTILFPVIRVGKKNLKKLKGQNYIISCNHMSNMDPIMMDIRMGQKYYILAKKELYKSKFSAFFMRGLGGVCVDRSNPDPQAVKTIFSLIKRKKNICVFPQATRCKTPMIDPETAREGVATFAIRTNTPVVPMMYAKKFKILRLNKLYIGEPIYPDPERKKDKEYLHEFSNLIITKMNELLKGENKK